MLARSGCPKTLSGSGYFGVHLVSQVARTVGRVKRIELGGEQPHRSTEPIARFLGKRGKQVRLCSPQAFVKGGEEFIAALT